jgi:17beta-estradiol 17-dehydrogenase / very-long-chain 3-oxoacyl-CoA reductase
MRDILGKLFSLTGGALTIYALYKLLDFTYLHFLRPSSLPRYFHAPGGRSASPWALVTGASDGIGKGFAEELCYRGFNVILHGRNEDKLNRVKEELMARWPDRLVRIILIDAHHVSNDIAIEGLAMALKEVYITVLINNIGGAGPVHPAWKELHKRTGKEVDALIDVNLRFSTHITRALLPILLRNTPSLVLNVGSLSGDIPTPYATVYSGAKAYNMAWSRSLKAEMVAQGKDVEVLGILVGATQSGHEKRKTSFFVPSSRRLACSALDKVGSGRAIVTAFPPHALQKAFVDLLPPWVVERRMIPIAKQEKANEDKQR